MTQDITYPPTSNGKASPQSPSGAAIRRQGRDSRRTIGDHYAELLANIQQPVHPVGRAPQVVGVTSCSAGEGVSSIASNLAVAAAQASDQSVLLVDAHLSRPVLNRTMSAPRAPGLSEYLSGVAELPDCLFACSYEHLTFLPAGNAPLVGNVGDAANVEALFESVRRDFSLIVIDLPPAEEFGDCLLLAGHLDGVLLVLAAERVATDLARRTADRLRRAGISILGAVLNGVR